MSIIHQNKILNGKFKTSLKKSSQYLFLKQTHSDIVIDYKDLLSNKEIEGDGIIWKKKDLKENIFPCVYTADCLPIILESKDAGAIVHAGWRGVKKQIYLNKKIRSIKPIHAYIGPSIQKENFEVTSEFKENFSESFFHIKEEKIFFDLQAQVIDDLKSYYPDIKITDSSLCTFKNIQYNSYRRTGLADRNYNFFEF